MIVIDREWLADGEPSPELIWEVLKQFDGERFRLNELKDYYDGEHSISERWRGRGAPNYRLSHDLPGYIVAMTSGYLTGEPIQYTVNGEWTGFQTLLDCLRRSAAGSVDSELAADAALYGKGVEMYYADENAMPRLCQADARNAFVVYDNTVEHRPVFGVMLTERRNRHFQRTGQRIEVMTEEWNVHYERTGGEIPRETGRERHFFGGVPMTEYWNNQRERGDFEGVKALIDAYDALQSDRVNDKQQFTDALMVIYGATVEEDEAGQKRPAAASGNANAGNACCRRAGGVSDETAFRKRHGDPEGQPEGGHPQAELRARPDRRGLCGKYQRRGHGIQAVRAGTADEGQRTLVPGRAAVAASADGVFSAAAGLPSAGGGGDRRAFFQKSAGEPAGSGADAESL